MSRSWLQDASQQQQTRKQSRNAEAGERIGSSFVGSAPTTTTTTTTTSATVSSQQRSTPSAAAATSNGSSFLSFQDGKSDDVLNLDGEATQNKSHPLATTDAVAPSQRRPEPREFLHKPGIITENIVPRPRHRAGRPIVAPFPTGTVINKILNGTLLQGKIVHHDARRRYYRIVYNDGAADDMTHAAIDRHLHLERTQLRDAEDFARLGYEHHTTSTSPPTPTPPRQCSPRQGFDLAVEQLRPEWYNREQRSTPSAAAAPSNGSSFLSFQDGKSDDVLNLDGALYRILEYLAPSDFYTLGSLVGNRFWKRFLFENPYTNYLFDPPGTKGITKGRKHLKNIYSFRQSVLGLHRAGDTNGRTRKRKGSQQQQETVEQQQQVLSLNRVGVFSPHDEDSILQDDTNGYFGISFFRSGVLAVWGDYSGIFLTPFVNRLFASDGPPSQQPLLQSAQLVSSNDPQTDKEDETIHADPQTDTKDEPIHASSSTTPIVVPAEQNQETTSIKEGCGFLFVDSYQVMAVLFCKPYVFLGFASGTIHSIDSHPVYKDPTVPLSSSPTPTPTPTTKNPTATASGKTIEYPHVSECKYHCRHHRGEISSLASIEDRHLVSGCVSASVKKSEILIHWNALVDGNLHRLSRIQIDARFWNVSPMAMASSSFVPDPGRCPSSKTVLSIGGRSQNLAHVCFWRTKHDTDENTTNNASIDDFSTNNNNDDVLPVFEPLLTFTSKIMLEKYNSRSLSVRRSHNFVFLKYFQTTKLIGGTNKGDIVKLHIGNEESREKEFVVLYNCCWGGMVEAVELVGNRNPIMITAGGRDGRIRFWDWETFHPLGTLKIHPGQKLPLVAEAALAARATANSSPSSPWPTPSPSPSLSSPPPRTRQRSSPVVSTFFCHERSSVVSFCRDGHLHEWKVHDEAKKTRTAITTNGKSSKNDTDDENDPPARRRSRRSLRFS